jgi:GDP-mannose 6-dehydrogenase
MSSGTAGAGSTTLRVAVLGLGYVGTVTAACLADRGACVVGIDPDATKVATVAAGRSPVVEPGLDEVMARTVASGRLRATSDPSVVAEVDVVLLCVGTPSAANGASDLSAIRRAAEQVGGALAGATRPVAVVVRSTVPPGTVESVVMPALAAGGRRVGEDVSVAMCPEFLREGAGLADFADPPFTVIGTEHLFAELLLRRLFAFTGRPFHVVPVRVAETLKYACNAFHATKISFANEVARLCRAIDVDARVVMSVFVQDDRLNASPAYLRPGFAYGGSCLPKDLRAMLHLGRLHDVELPLLTGVQAVNEGMLADAIGVLRSSTARRVAVLGLSFKASTDDLRESPYVELVERLVGKGYEVRVYDPVVRPERLRGSNLGYVERHLPHLRQLLVDDADDAVEGADAVVIAIDDPEAVDAVVFRKPDLVLDLCGRLPEVVEELPGYVGIGW